MNVTTKIDPWLLRTTNGRFSSMSEAPVLLLKHTGAKSGQTSETPLDYATDGDDIILIASYGGSPNNPAWYHNLKATPECEVVVKDRSGPYVARELAGEERSAMWESALDVYGGYEVYQDRTDGRLIPLLRLERA